MVAYFFTFTYNVTCLFKNRQINMYFFCVSMSYYTVTIASFLSNAWRVYGGICDVFQWLKLKHEIFTQKIHNPYTYWQSFSHNTSYELEVYAAMVCELAWCSAVIICGCHGLLWRLIIAPASFCDVTHDVFNCEYKMIKDEFPVDHNDWFVIKHL